MLAVEVHIDSHNLRVWINCIFLTSFYGFAHCEIRFTDSTFTHLKFSAVSREKASAGESVFVNNVTLNASTVYHYNVSAVLEDESTPMVVVQGIITTPTSEMHTSKLVSKC